VTLRWKELLEIGALELLEQFDFTLVCSDQRIESSKEFSDARLLGPN